MPIIMVTNDDGINSPGIKALQEAMTALGQTVVVAPERDNSAVSHSLTMSRPLRVRELGENMFTLDGTPTDCVAVGIGKLLELKPDLLVSGINAGPNLGDDITYSGTVSAAIEGTMYSIPSLALSLAGDPPYDYSLAIQVATCLARRILMDGLPDNTLLNVNIPAGGLFKGFTVTRQGRRLWENSIQETFDPWGHKHYWIGGGTPLRDSSEDTDVSAVHNGFVSVTPIHLDLTNHQGIKHLQGVWQLETAGL
ncbi:MAG: 5'/3'-nucleotidase SurE [Desulfoprunum sp.]|nr:5'/3'-nucleotidase SurE [Desulfoprunum sp.]